MRERLLRADTDDSGALETSEVERLECTDIWEVASLWNREGGGNVWVSYGLAPGLLFRGDRLGFAASSVGAISSLTRACGAAPPQPGEDPTARRLRALEAPASAAWDGQVASILLEVFDSDGSGWLDRPLEVQEIPCEVYETLDASIRAATDSGFFSLYGVDPTLIWIGNELGFEESMRETLGGRLAECDLVGGTD